MSSPKSTYDRIRDEILIAARRRFQHYGYTKTKLSEIATDVNMSTANLYRYFTNKRSIARACCMQILDEDIKKLQNAVIDPQLSPKDRLKQYALFHLTHSQSAIVTPNSRNEFTVTTALLQQSPVAKRKIF